jgi:hypothetical protein
MLLHRNKRSICDVSAIVTSKVLLLELETELDAIMGWLVSWILIKAHA